MVFQEDKNTEFKSLKLVIGKQADVTALAETCVCFANAQGGEIIVGIENNQPQPPSDQKVSQNDVNKVISRLRSLTDGVAIANPEIIEHENGGQYFKFRVLPSSRVIATTSSGKIFVRVSDNCYPIRSEELTNLAAEKGAFQWELITVQKLRLGDADRTDVREFISGIQESDKVSSFVKQKSTEEILQYYQMLSPDGFLTNLGILWLGKPPHRARLSYPITFQYIVYNDRGEKIRKKDWHFHIHNPKQLLLEIEREAVELNYSIEISSGLFRKSVRNYPREVIRELLINAIAHKRYTTSGDIFLEVYPDKIVFTNPGGLPLGISKDNILHERQRRNPHLIQTLHDLGLMEGEGSGYDLIFEKLTRDAKPLPEIESDFNKMSVTVRAGVINNDVLTIIDYIDKHFSLTQKEMITLGMIAAERKILSTQLSSKLQLSQEEKLKSWLGTLVQNGIVVTRGAKKGTEYLLNPELFSQAQLDITPTLKTIEPHALEALIKEDLKYNGKSKMADVQLRIKGVPKEDIQKMLYKLVEKGELEIDGANKNRTYSLFKKK